MRFQAKKADSPEKRSQVKKVANAKFATKQKEDLGRQIGQQKIKRGFQVPQKEQKAHEDLAAMSINLEFVKTKLPPVKKNMKSKHVQAQLETP